MATLSTTQEEEGLGVALTLETIPDLQGPDSYHVYIGYLRNKNSQSLDAGTSVTDLKLYKDIWEMLNNHMFKVYTDDTTASRSDNVDDGIQVSQKILLIFTPKYQSDTDMSQYEKKRALEKAKYRGTGSLVLLLCDVSEDQLETRFKGFPTVIYKSDDASREETFQRLIHLLAKDSLPNPRNNDKTNMGYTLACSYFYGYLQCVLPGISQRIIDSGTMKNDKGEIIMSTKLFTVLPESCCCPVELNNVDSSFQTHSHIPFNASHAGNKSRDYKAVVSEIISDGPGKNKKVYRAVIEYAAALTVLWDMSSDSAYLMSKQEATREMQLFYFHLKCLLAQHKDLAKNIRLVYFKDKRENCSDVLINAIREEIKIEKEAEMHPGTVTSPDRSKAPAGFKVEQSPHLKVILEQKKMAYYPLQNSTRGKAFIINNVEFTAENLKSRPGSEEDQQRMVDLLKFLRFDVKLELNKTAGEIKDMSAIWSTQDFEEDQAIVVCIMTHGILGRIYGTDGELVNITDITDDLNNNTTLARKPKMFFIQACQKGQREDESRLVSQTSPSSEGSDFFINPVKSVDNDADSAVFTVGDHNGTDLPPGDPISTYKILESEPKTTTLSDPTSPVTPINNLLIHFAILEEDAGAPCEKSIQAELVPGAPDFLMSYATLPGCLSYRHIDEGSFYIQALCDNIQKRYREMPLDRILMKVTEDVKNKMAELFPGDKFKDRQFPFYIPTTEQLIFL